jgi:hypothetical protein
MQKVDALPVVFVNTAARRMLHGVNASCFLAPEFQQEKREHLGLCVGDDNSWRYILRSCLVVQNHLIKRRERLDEWSE